MANPSYTYSFTNGTTSDASQVNQNFNDILNGVTDGTKDLSISALTVAGTATFNGNCNLGNASADDVTFTGSLASTIPIKTDDTYNIGSSSLRLSTVFAHKYYGTQTNDAAGSGYIGEEVLSVVLAGSAVGISTGTAKTVTSISVPTGDWDIDGDVVYAFAGSPTYANGAINTTTDTLPSADTPSNGVINTGRSLVTANIVSEHMVIPNMRVSVASTTTYYLIARAGFSSTATAFGFIRARRLR